MKIQNRGCSIKNPSHTNKMPDKKTMIEKSVTKNCPAILTSNPLKTESKGRVNWTLSILSSSKTEGCCLFL